MELWHLVGHLIIASIISFFVYRKTKNIRLVFLCIFCSFAIDTDHLFDFWMAYGFSLDMIEFFKFNFFNINQAVYIPLHSWELIGLIIILGRFVKKYRWLLLTIGLAMFFHVLWDAASYRIILINYSLIYRLLNNFSLSIFNGC